MGLNKVVGFSTAKLLKENGFDNNCNFGYSGEYEPHHLKLIEFGYLQKNSELIKNVFTAPTIAEVVMWLYEKHGIWISVKTIKWNYEHNTIRFNYNICKFNHNNSSDITDVVYDFNSPTEAYESAIEYTLKNLI